MWNRICLVSDKLTAPYDEGLKKFAYSLLEGLKPQARTLAICIGGPGAENSTVRYLKANRLFLDYQVASALRHFQPELVFYLPSSSATPFSFFRSWLLRRYCPGSRVVMIALQPHRYNSFWRRLIPWFVPDLTLAQSQEVADGLVDMGCPVRLIPTGVNLETFSPVSAGTKAALRKQYGFDEDAFILLHIGHIKKERNVLWLKDVQPLGQPVLVGSTSTHQEPEVRKQLERAGVRVIDRFLPRIQEVYQLSDCYLFPVLSPRASIQVPLSVLEAMACNLPVVSTPYGGLPQLFSAGRGLYYANNLAEVFHSLSQVRSQDGCYTRDLVASLAWPRIIEELLWELGNRWA